MDKTKPKHFNTLEGHVFGNIAFLNRLTFRELRREMGLENDELYSIIGKLIDDGSIYIWRENPEYRPNPSLKRAYQTYLNSLSEEELDDIYWEGYDLGIEKELPWANYIQLFCEKAEIPYNPEQGFFYLDDEKLAVFQDVILTRPCKRIMLVNPYIHYPRLIRKLIALRKRRTQIQIITRPPDDDFKKDMHKELHRNDVRILYNERVHAKIIMMDGILALMSSMNFTESSMTPYEVPIRGSWEAGTVITNPVVLDEIKDSILQLNVRNYGEYFSKS